MHVRCVNDCPRVALKPIEWSVTRFANRPRARSVSAAGHLWRRYSADNRSGTSMLADGQRTAASWCLAQRGNCPANSSIAMTLDADQRRVLILLARQGHRRDGDHMQAHGFRRYVIADLVGAGFGKCRTRTGSAARRLRAIPSKRRGGNR